MPVISLSEQIPDVPYRLLNGFRPTIGWQFRPPDEGGPAFVILRRAGLGPLKVVTVADQHYDTWVLLLGNPLVKIYILVLVMFSFFHFAHRIRYFLVDLGLHAAKSVPAQVVFYGGAVVVTLATIWILLTSTPVRIW